MYEIKYQFLNTYDFMKNDKNEKKCNLKLNMRSRMRTCMRVLIMGI